MEDAAQSNKWADIFAFKAESEMDESDYFNYTHICMSIDKEPELHLQ